MNILSTLLSIICIFSGICYGNNYFIPVIIKDLPCYSNVIEVLGGYNGTDYSEEKLNVVILEQESKKICRISGNNKFNIFATPFGLFYVDDAASVAKSIEKAIHFISLAEKMDVVINRFIVEEFESTTKTVLGHTDNRLVIAIEIHPKFSQSCVEIRSYAHSLKDKKNTSTSIALSKDEALKLANALKTAFIKSNNGDQVAEEIIKCVDK